jgi:hypothetical protein
LSIEKRFHDYTHEDEEQAGTEPAHNGFPRSLVRTLPFNVNPDTANKPDERADGNDQVKGDVHEGGHLGDCPVNAGRVQCKRAKNKEEGSRCKTVTLKRNWLIVFMFDGFEGFCLPKVHHCKKRSLPPRHRWCFKKNETIFAGASSGRFTGNCLSRINIQDEKTIENEGIFSKFVKTEI